jgi:hypothetical protein
MSAFVAQATPAVCLPAALLLLLVLGLLISNSNHVRLLFSDKSDHASRQQASLLQGGASTGPAVGEVQSSIIVMVTSKESSRDRRSWLRTQLKINVALLRKQDPTAADGVVIKFAVGKEEGGPGEGQL